MNSYTSARVYITVPNALSLNQSQLDQYYSDIKAANVNWVRITLPWNVVQPNAPTVTTTTTWWLIFPITTTTVTPTFEWAAADLAINRALAAGLNVQVLLAPPKPNWVARIDPSTFTNFAKYVANRYKPGGAGIAPGNAGRFVAEYQVWHEPNVIANWTGTIVSASQYTAVLKAAYTAIKASHSGAVVVAAGLQACTSLGGARQDPVAFLSAMYSSGAKGYLDVAAYNPLTLPTDQFPDPPAPSGLTMKQADAFYAALKARDAGRKVYWRFGFQTPTMSTVQQAAYLDTMRWFAEERKAWVAGIVLPQWRDY